MVGSWPKSRPAQAIRSIVFFGLLYLYLWLMVQPQLISSCGTITNFPVFYTGWPFFRECLSYPGGLLRYLCALLPQFFYYSWAGALVITAQAWAISAGTDWLLGMLAVPGRRLLRFVPPLLVVVTYAQYSYHFPALTGAVVSVLFACLYITMGSRGANASSQTRRAAVYLLLSVVSYVVGGGTFPAFAALCLIYELLYRRGYGVALACLLLGITIPYVVGVLVFHASIVNAYTDTLPVSWQIRDWVTRQKMINAVYALCLFPVGIVLVWGLGRGVASWWSSRRAPAQTRPADKKLPVRPAQAAKSLGARVGRWVRGPAVRWTVGSAFVWAAGATVAVVSLDGPQKALLAVHHHACQRQWAEVLRASPRCRDKYVVMNAVDRALYHTGRLNQDLFTYLQHPDALVCTGADHGLFYWHWLDTLLDLGLLNLAEKNLTECMEMFGEHPMILQRLALVNFAKGKMAAGRIYLEKLRRTLFFSTWARDYLQRLAADPTLAADPQMQQWRSHALRKDSPGSFYAPEPMLLALAEQGSQNRMAFEYLMAWYLMEKRLDKFVKNLGRLPDFGYTAFPPLYQEATLIYATKYPVRLGDFAIRPEVQQRIKQFSDIFNRYGRNKDAAFSELAGNFAGSYFFYFIYAASPARQ